MTLQEPHHTSGRAGAMTAALRGVAGAAPRTALRVAIVRGGKILHDCVLSEQGPVSIGRAEHNRFVVAGANMPKSLALFEVDAHGFLLRFTPAMTGRVTLDGTTFELATAVQQGIATTQDGAFVLRLTNQAQGKVSLGDISVLFERVAGPVRATQAQLPQSVRNGLAKSIDWMFTAFVVSSFLVHFGFVVYLESADRPVEDVAERIRTARLLLDDLDIPSPDRDVPARLPTRDNTTMPTARDSKPSQPNQPTQPRGDKSQQPSVTAMDAQRFAAEARKQVENLMLGTAAMTGGRALDDMLRDGALTSKAADLFAVVEGSGIASRTPGGLLNTRSPEDGERGHGLGSLSLSSHGVGPVAERLPLEEGKVRGKVEAGRAEDEGGSGELDAAEVTREIKKRLGAIRSCYEHALRRDAGLAGKLVVTFTIEQSGSVSHVAVREDSMRDQGLSKCVGSAIALLRVRVPPSGGSVDFSYPFVFRGEP